jgi:pyrimidine-specific ribonucleoside hydrolase
MMNKLIKLSMRRFLASIAFFIFLFVLNANAQKPSVIFDSDMGPDYDDVGAIAMLHAFADSGKVNILATVASTRFEGVASVFDVLNTYFKRPNLPIGVPKGAAVEQKDWQHWTDTLIKRYPHRIQKNAEARDAIDVYREVLSKAPDKSVTIITVGFLTNLANLLQSKPDKHSKLGGKELVEKKVKSLVSMAGWFPKGKEFNVHMDAKSSQLVFSQWPTPILLSGGEIGMKIKTGLPLSQNASIKNSPVKDVFSLCIPMDKQDVNGRSSWDETAVLIAVKGHERYYTTQCGRIVVAQDGSNTWDEKGKGHCYVVEKLSIAAMEKVINDLIAHQP